MSRIKKSRTIKILSVIGMILILIAAFVCFEIYISYNWLSVNQFELESDQIDQPVKLVILADLHDHDFRTSLTDKIREQNPDAILMAGDMINKDTKKPGQICELIGTLKEIAPVYYGLGNHEVDYMKSDQKLPENLEESGCDYLDREYVDITLNGSKIRIGGLYDYPYGMGDCRAKDADDEIVAFMNDFMDTDDFRILIAHRPESFLFGDVSEVYQVDLAVAGHLHGGQAVIPFFGGIWGGDQGLFPEYVHGLYEKDNIRMIITSGLGSSKKRVPRFNNIPEIMVLTIR